MLGQTVAGYRLVRKLGAGSRSQVFLGHAGGEAPRNAAIKVFLATATTESISAEVRALSAADHAHVVHLRDLSSVGDSRPTLVFERLELGTLGQLLAARGGLSAGEAVTVLAPIAAAVGALQSSGVAHSAITASRVLFRESGAPVLCGFGHAVVDAQPDQLEADARDLAALAATVLGHAPEAAEIRAWLDSLLVHREDFAERLSERLFAMAEAVPVRFAAESGGSAGAQLVPARSHSATPVVEAPQAPVTTPWRARIDPYLARVPERLRKPRYLAIAAGLVTVLVGFAAGPSGGQAVDVEPSAAPSAVDTGPVVDDDPVAAFDELARARDTCIRDLSLLCLDAVLQPDSAAMDDDVALIQSIERGDGGDAELAPHNIAVVERMGDAALLSFETGEPATPSSVLLVKGETGWRIRSYIAG